VALGDRFEEVLAAARTGAEWAWRLLYTDLAPILTGYLRSRGAVDPEDVTGEVFLQVVKGLPAFEGTEDGFRSWVFVIAHHRLLDDVRARSRRPQDAVPTEAMAGFRGAADVEEEALGSVSLDELRRVIEELSPDQADVLLLRFLGGLSIDEVAQAVGKRPGAVKALQHRGVKALTKLLGDRGVSLTGEEALTES
jgi:RNA polymerase sigma factor (sigma-70 family)